MIDILLPWLVVLLAFIYVACFYLNPRYSHYISRQKTLDAINARYETLRASRRQLVTSIDFALDRGEAKKAREMEGELEGVDKELEKLGREYKAVEGGEKVKEQ